MGHLARTHARLVFENFGHEWTNSSEMFCLVGRLVYTYHIIHPSGENSSCSYEMFDGFNDLVLEMTKFVSVTSVQNLRFLTTKCITKTNA